MLGWVLGCISYNVIRIFIVCHQHTEPELYAPIPPHPTPLNPHFTTLNPTSSTLPSAPLSAPDPASSSTYSADTYRASVLAGHTWSGTRVCNCCGTCRIRARHFSSANYPGDGEERRGGINRVDLRIRTVDQPLREASIVAALGAGGWGWRGDGVDGVGKVLGRGAQGEESEENGWESEETHGRCLILWRWERLVFRRIMRAES